MSFIQIIEFATDDIDAFVEEVRRWGVESADWRTATRATLCADRDRPGTYVQLVEFPSYEAAMANSNDPRTSEFAARLGTIATAAPTFRNLDLLQSQDL